VHGAAGSRLADLVDLLSDGGAEELLQINVPATEKPEPIYQIPAVGIREQQGRRGLIGRRIVRLQ